MKAVLDQNVLIANSCNQTGGEKSGQSMDAASGWNKTMMQNLETYQKFVNHGFDNLEAFFFVPHAQYPRHGTGRERIAPNGAWS